MGNGVSQALWLESQCLLRAAGNWLWPVMHNIITYSITQTCLWIVRNTSTVHLQLSGFFVVTFVVTLECWLNSTKLWPGWEQQHREHVTGPDLFLCPMLSRDGCHHVPSLPLEWTHYAAAKTCSIMPMTEAELWGHHAYREMMVVPTTQTNELLMSGSNKDQNKVKIK